MLINWPCPFIFWTEISNHEQLKESLYPKIIQGKDNPEYHNIPSKARNIGESKWECDVITSFFHRDDIRGIFMEKNIEDMIGTPLEQMFDDPDYRGLKNPIHTNLTEIWYNIYEKENHQEIHAHHGATFSGIYLFELNEPNTTTFFTNNSVYEYGNGPGSYYTTEHIKEGNVLIFPSEFSHMVRKTSKFRITISFNLKCIF